MHWMTFGGSANLRYYRNYSTARSCQNTKNSCNLPEQILWDSGTFDSDSILGSSKFTPAIAGYYFINALLPFDEVADTTVAYCMIYKNGSHYLSQASSSGRGTDLLTPHLSAILYLDGDDYVEIYGQHNHGSARNVIGNSSTEAYFSGFRLTGL